MQYEVVSSLMCLPISVLRYWTGSYTGRNIATLVVYGKRIGPILKPISVPSLQLAIDGVVNTAPNPPYNCNQLHIIPELILNKYGYNSATLTY